MATGADLTENRSNFFLMGKLLGNNHNHSAGGFMADLGSVLKAWAPRGAVNVADLGNKFFLFSFDSDRDFVRAWAGGTVFIGKACLVIRRWRPETQLVLDDREMSYAQVWIRLPGGLYRRRRSVSPDAVVSAVAGAFDHVIAVDISGDELCVCVELDVSQPLVPEVVVVDDDDDGGGGVLYCQPLQYEINRVCFNCRRMDGHLTEECDHVEGEGEGEFGPGNVVPVRHAIEPPYASLRYVSWRRPPPGWIKLNFDGAVRGQRGSAGALLRDPDGEFVASLASPVAAAATRPLLAEIYALRDGLRMADELGVEYLCIEGDSRIAIEMLNGWREAAADDSQEHHVMADCRNLVKKFKGTSARHVFREANGCADHLANMAMKADYEWRSSRSPPPSLLPLLWTDIAGHLMPRLAL